MSKAFALAPKLRSFNTPLAWLLIAATMAFAMGATVANAFSGPQGRHLSLEERGALVEVLKSYPGGVGNVEHTASADARGYANDFVDVFKAAGWSVQAREVRDKEGKSVQPVAIGIGCKETHERRAGMSPCAAFVRALDASHIAHSAPWYTHHDQNPDISISVYDSPYREGEGDGK